MRSTYTVHIMPSEWRWVIVIASGLVLLAFAPFILVAISGALGNQWQFMGVLHNYLDGATYLSKMLQGMEGAWQIHFQHTPEDHTGAFIQIIYPLMGHLARLVNLPPIVMFHVARVAASVFMYMAIYQLAASIWMRLRTRRIFFVLLSLGAGLGWLYALLTGQIDSPDLSIPEAFPLYSTFVNVHFPLAIACLALLASIIVSALRPGMEKEPAIDNGGLLAGAISLALSMLYPQALVPFGGALVAYIAVHWLKQRDIALQAIRWLMWISLPALPLAVYYFAVVSYNPAMAEWNRQNVTFSPPLLALMIGFGLPLLMALPGIYRAVRRFEPDGDRFMLIWLIAILLVMYLPMNVQRRFAIGMMIPITYFATRAMEDFWFHRISHTWRYRIFIIIVPLIILSHLFVLFLPILPVLTGNLSESQGLFLERDYFVAFRWLEEQTTPKDVILAAPQVSSWLPGWSGARVVYGHPYETLYAEDKKASVLDWYDGETQDCSQLLAEYHVRYVLVGPQEKMLGESTCPNMLDLRVVVRFGSVTIYAT